MYVAEFSTPHLMMHAGVVAWKGKAIVLPGTSHAGKTTLVTALVEAGATYYSDEYAVLDAKGHVSPYARRLSLRDGPFGEARRARLSGPGPRWRCRDSNWQGADDPVQIWRRVGVRDRSTTGVPCSPCASRPCRSSVDQRTAWASSVELPRLRPCTRVFAAISRRRCHSSWIDIGTSPSTFQPSTAHSIPAPRGPQLLRHCW